MENQQETKPQKKKRSKESRLSVTEAVNEYGLTQGQELFCRYYVSHQFWQNGVLSYCMAYNKNPENKRQYNVAKVEASKHLTKPNILKRLDDLLADILNDASVDKELAFVILQRDDLPSKMAAIREYNKVKKRVDDSTRVIIPISQINILPHDDEGNKLESDQKTTDRVKISAGQRKD